MKPSDVYALTGVADPRLDPTGRLVAYLVWSIDEEESEYRGAIWVGPADGSEPAKQITHGDCEDGAPAWSPDGTKIAFSALRGDRWDTEVVSALFLVDAAGGEPERITPPDGSYGSPSWSPDGTRIAYHFDREDGTFPHNGQIGVLELASGERRLLTESLDRQCTPFPESREPLWHAEGIVFAAEDRGNAHLYSVSPNGSGAPELLVSGEQA